MRLLVIALLALAGLLVAADFGAAALAESAVSRQMRSELGLADDPAVRINGFPFLTQAVSGHYSGIDVEANRIAVGPLRELSVSAQLRDVEAPLAMLLGSGEKTLVVGEVEGTVRVPAGDIERLVPEVVDLRIETLDQGALEQTAEDSDAPALADLDPERTVRLVATSTLPESLPESLSVTVPGLAAGDEVEVRVLTSLELADGLIRIVPRDVQLGGQPQLPTIPAMLQSSFSRMFAVPIDPGALPLQVTPTDVRASNGLLEISGTASDLTLGSGSPLSTG